MRSRAKEGIVDRIPGIWCRRRATRWRSCPTRASSVRRIAPPRTDPRPSPRGTLPCDTRPRPRPPPPIPTTTTSTTSPSLSLSLLPPLSPPPPSRSLYIGSLRRAFINSSSIAREREETRRRGAFSPLFLLVRWEYGRGGVVNVTQ